MELADALTFARANRQSVLTTIRNDGKPQLSNVIHHCGEDGVVRVSITATRAKYVNLSKRPWAALHISAPDFWSYAVLEGDVTLAAVAAAPDDATVEELVDLYRKLAGEHPDWAEYREAMVAEQRTVVHLTPTRAYGLLRGS
jgi:PPOX class probable F420-dependent enzyme